MKKTEILRSLIPSAIFCFKYLPLRQAIKIPICVYKIDNLGGGGKIEIDCENIYRGMIQLGFPRAATYPNSGVVWRNKGRVVFKGRCVIGNDCSVIVGKQAKLVIGDLFHVNAGLKLVTECSVTFGPRVLLGWGVTIIDTNFHYVYDIEKQTNKRAFAPINIGADNWISTECLVLNGVNTPQGCIFGAKTVITRNYKMEPYCLYGGSPMRLLSRNVMRRYGKDCITDYTYKEDDC